MATWEGKVATLRADYMAGAENLTIRNRLALRWLESRGRLVGNAKSFEAFESVQKSEPPVETHGEAGIINFARHNLWDQAKNGWRGYVATDLMYRQEEMEAKGDVVLVNRYGTAMDNLSSAVRNQIHKDLYINGSASGNSRNIEGLDTFCQHTAGSTAAADKIAYPSGTYRNITTVPGQEGTWTSALSTYPCNALAKDWPDGSGDSEWDYWTAKLVKTDSTQFGTGTGWEENCEHILSELNVWMRNLSETTGSELVLITDGRMNTQFKSKMRARNYHLMPLKDAVDLGFPQVLNYEGLGIHFEFGIPVNTGFCWNFEHAELRSLAPGLLFSDGPSWNMDKQAWQFLIGFYGNLVCKPKFFAKLAPFTASA